MHSHGLQVGSLVLYRSHPARVAAIGEKIEIVLEKGRTKRVRPKDIALLHPGPLASLDALTPQRGELEEAWELLEGTETDLPELAELIFSTYTPATAWATWQLVADGLLFQGTPQSIQVCARAQVEKERARRQAKAAAERDWAAFLERLETAALTSADRNRLKEVEQLALMQREGSRILQALGHPQTPVQAHRLLVRVGYWPEDQNPHPARLGLPDRDPDLPVPELPEEDRLDLTHLAAYAIDDEGNRDPDDALSLEGDRLWVHVADVAALVAPDSALDREARSRGANQYRPEGAVNMLPEAVTLRLGLGLQARSPALSFGFRCDASGQLVDVAIHPSWVRVQRRTYGEVEARFEEEPFRSIWAWLEPFRRRRRAAGALSLAFPEVSIQLQKGQVSIRPLPRYRSRDLVMEAMLLAGEGAARFCQDRGIPIPYAIQPPPDSPGEPPRDLAGMYAYRRRLKPSRLVTEPAPHFGLGLARYTRATSPLRRYSDLLVHQQIRAQLRGEPLIEREALTARMGEAEVAAGRVRRGERLSHQHWKLVFLRAHPSWTGEAVVVDEEEHKTVLLVPELALELRQRLQKPSAPNARLGIALRSVDIPDLTCRFRVSG